ncbi:DUF4917 family protein [Chitinophaga pollutisoli]|uniref:DUF4917 family protein n=1 Tax=Chitinophaga pollutisoli TaxID=3133966 RepID=A0ABZ2YP38_9BACT
MRIYDYSDVRKKLENGTSHLLLGNGFSISFSDVFSYESLFKKAVDNGLSDNAIKVFDLLGTNNFEGVLRVLNSTAAVASFYYDLDDNGDLIYDDVRIIKETLIKTIAESHLHHTGEVPNNAKDSCIDFLMPYKSVFTTNYDLLLYWVNMHSGDRPIFGDGFRAEFENPDAEYVVFAERLGGDKGIYHLHGALHLYFSDGYIKKHCWSRTKRPLIDLIKSGLDNNSFPLFVAEGSPEKKVEQINSNAYLSYCLSKLGRITNRLVVFGNTLGASDGHIVDAIADNDKLIEVCIGLYGDVDSPTNQETIKSAQSILDRRAKMNVFRKRKDKELNLIYYKSDSIDIWS